MFTCLIFIDDAGNAILAIDAGCTLRAILSVIAILDTDVDCCRVLAINAIFTVRSGRTCQSDMTDAVLTTD